MNISPPSDAQTLGFAGLLPQLAFLLTATFAGPQYHFAALALGYAYAALVFSFIGGMWWGVAAATPTAPRWLWLAAIAPSLIALISFVPWTIGEKWPGPSLILLTMGIAGSLLVDRRAMQAELAPPWWMTLRWPLSGGLGLLTLALAIVAG